VGNSKGEILLVNYRKNEVVAMVPIPGDCEVKNIVFSRKGVDLLTSSSDRIIRIFQNILPPTGKVTALVGLKEKIIGLKGVEKLKAIGTMCLTLVGELQD